MDLLCWIMSDGRENAVLLLNENGDGGKDGQGEVTCLDKGKRLWSCRPGKLQGSIKPGAETVGIE